MNINGISNPQTVGLQETAEAPERAQAAASEQGGAILTGSALTVSAGDVNKLVETLKAETDDRRRDVAQSRLSSAMDVLMGSMSIDGKDKEFLKQIEEKMGEIDRLKQSLEGYDKVLADLAGQLQGVDSELTVLKLKTEALEAAVERMKKTPEEQRTEEEKEALAEAESEKRKLDGLVADKTAQKVRLEGERKAAEDDKAACQAGISSADAAVIGFLGQISEDVRNAFAEALKLALDEDELRAEPKEKPKDPNEKDAETQLLELLGGAKLADVIEGKRTVKA